MRRSLGYLSRSSELITLKNAEKVKKGPMYQSKVGCRVAWHATKEQKIVKILLLTTAYINWSDRKTFLGVTGSALTAIDLRIIEKL